MKSHGTHNGHIDAIKYIVDDALKELNDAERWTAFRRNVASSLHELRSLKTVGM